MVRITPKNESASALTLTVEGRIVSVWGDELERECQRQLGRGKQVLLDFSSVTYVDRRGVETLRRIIQGAVVIVNQSALITDLLRDCSAGM